MKGNVSLSCVFVSSSSPSPLFSFLFFVFLERRNTRKSAVFRLAVIYFYGFFCAVGERKGGGGGSFFSIYFLSIFDLFSEKRCI